MNLQLIARTLGFYVRLAPSYTQLGYLARRLFWRRLTPDFRGQRWLVTGASGGLGREIALAAARAGAEVIAVARDPAKLAGMLADARIEGLASIDTRTCDLSLHSEIGRLLDLLAAEKRPLDVLVNNVGVLLDALALTTEGRERSFATNLLGHYQLTEGLIERGRLAQQGLVLNLTSGGAYNVALDVRRLNVLDPRRYSGILAYAFHKRAQIVLNQHWRNRHGPGGRTFYVMHPGWADTAGVEQSLPRFHRLMNPILRTPASGIDTVIWLAARRPPQEERELVWFDRKPRSAHLDEHTKQSRDDAASLVALLDAELARGAVPA